MSETTIPNRQSGSEAAKMFLMNKESRKIGIRSESGNHEAKSFLFSWVPGFLIKNLYV